MAKQIELEIKGMEELKKAFRRFPEVARHEFMSTLGGTAAVINRSAKRNAPKGKTKRLYQSITTTTMREGYRVSVGAYYGVYVDQGTDPHVIRPRNAKALRFTIGNKVVFAKKVNHPGTKATHFFTNAVQRDGQKYADREFPKALDRVLTSI